MISIDKIKKVFSDDALDPLRDDYIYEQFCSNVLYMDKKKIEDIPELIEMYYPIFLNDFSYFKNKLDVLINDLGTNYVDIIANDSSVLERLM